MSWLPEIIDQALARERLLLRSDDSAEVKSAAVASQGRIAAAIAEAVQQRLQEQAGDRQPQTVVIHNLVVKVQLNYCRGTTARLDVRNG